MIGQFFLPAAALRQYIKGYQLWHFEFADHVKLPFKPYAPRPEQVLVFCPRGYELVEHTANSKIIQRPRSYVMGQYTERTNRHIGTHDFITLLVNFHPGVLFRITGIPYYQLTNIFVDAETIFTREIRLANERLNSTDNYLEMIDIVEKFLFGLVSSLKKEQHPLDRVANMVIENPGNTSLMQLAKDSFLCKRQFERKFRERMGVTPKLFARIARASKAFRAKYLWPHEDWLSIALECGYHDYQHLAKDFLEFAGTTPVTYLQEDLGNAPELFFGLRDSSLR